MGERVRVWGDVTAFGTEYVFEVADEDKWFPHPENGIVVCGPSHPPVWIRVEANGVYRQDYIDGTQTEIAFIPDEPYTPLAHETRKSAELANAVLLTLGKTI